MPLSAALPSTLGLAQQYQRLPDAASREGHLVASTTGPSRALWVAIDGLVERRDPLPRR